MIVIKKIADYNSGNPIPFASIELIDRNGIFLGAGTSADVDGNFSIDSVMMAPGTFLKITSSGYKSQAIDFDTYSKDETQTFYLVPDVVELPEVVITAIKKGFTDNKNLIYVGLALGALYLLTRKK